MPRDNCRYDSPSALRAEFNIVSENREFAVRFRVMKVG
jgi:hypothetical protein